MSARGHVTRPARQSARERNPRSVDATATTARAPSASITAMLWGRAAGRCQFEGCNKPVYLVGVTQEVMNVADRAHIRAFSEGGPRARKAIAGEHVHEIGNVMLLCHEHHLRIDHGDGPSKYTEPMLCAMKHRHEERIRIVTGIAPSMASHVVLYGTHVGAHAALPAFDDAARAMFPNRYPAEQCPTELGSRDSAYRDRDAEFWVSERKKLHRQFEMHVRERRTHAEIGHVSMFAIAPQPLLIELGVLLGDMTDVDVFQLHREPRGWSWPADVDPQGFIVEESLRRDSVPALVLAVSAPITMDRITRVLGEAVSPYLVTVPKPHNDVLRSRSMLREFRSSVRQLMARIREVHGVTPVHVFPALPVALAVELGRVRMPKADAPWLVYDEQQALGGFVPAFTISEAHP